jgi:hypothetical protein
MFFNSFFELLYEPDLKTPKLKMNLRKMRRIERFSPVLTTIFDVKNFEITYFSQMFQFEYF